MQQVVKDTFGSLSLPVQVECKNKTCAYEWLMNAKHVFTAINENDQRLLFTCV